MLVEFHPKADEELAKNAIFYEQQVLGLGYRFLEEIERSLGILKTQPRIGTPLTKPFRFSLIYSLEVDRIWGASINCLIPAQT